MSDPAKRAWTVHLKLNISRYAINPKNMGGLVRRDFFVVPDSVFLFSENSQIFFGRFLIFFQISNLFFLLLFCFPPFSIKI